jgi:hypothetical protein
MEIDLVALDLLPAKTDVAKLMGTLLNIIITCQIRTSLTEDKI